MESSSLEGDRTPLAARVRRARQAIPAAAGESPAERDQWKSALHETRLFAPLSEAEVDYVHHIDAGGFLALAVSWSWIANLPRQQRTTVLNRVARLLEISRTSACATAPRSNWTRVV